MKNGILREDEGYDILINGERLTFRDVRQVAIDSAIYGKRGRYKNDLVEVLDRSTGAKMLVLPDGRLA